MPHRSVTAWELLTFSDDELAHRIETMSWEQRQLESGLERFIDRDHPIEKPTPQEKPKDQHD
jgi:hypothetical protein